MERQPHPYGESLAKLLGTAVGLYVLKELAFSAFADQELRENVRKEVEERAAGACETCRRDIPSRYSVLSHRDHSPLNGQYANPDDLTYNCRRCEAELHLKNFHTPGILGLNKKKNANAAYAAINRLTDEDYGWIIENYSTLFAQLIRYYKPKD